MNREKLENMMTNIWGEQFAKEKADLIMRRHGMLDVEKFTYPPRKLCYYPVRRRTA